MTLRHECKHEITACDVLVLRQRLRAVARLDPHAVDGRYRIRSLYFDTPGDTALRDNRNGVNIRDKFRIRYYNGDPSVIHLEKKSKRGGLGYKQSASLTADEVRALLCGTLDWMDDPSRPLLRALRMRMTTQGLAPKVIVDYTREPYIYAPGNVRVTIDYDIRTSRQVDRFLEPDCPTLPPQDAPILLEVKWDEFLPSVIRDCVQLESRRTAAYSKYAACRVYG